MHPLSPTAIEKISDSAIAVPEVTSEANFLRFALLGTGVKAFAVSVVCFFKSAPLLMFLARKALLLIIQSVLNKINKKQ